MKKRFSKDETFTEPKKILKTRCDMCAKPFTFPCSIYEDETVICVNCAKNKSLNNHEKLYRI